jgi:hypothetical protein
MPVNALEVRRGFVTGLRGWFAAMAKFPRLVKHLPQFPRFKLGTLGCGLTGATPMRSSPEGETFERRLS